MESQQRKKMIIKQDKDNEIPAEIIAKAIIKISEAMKMINDTRLTREAIVILISSKSDIPRRDVRIVLDNLENMETTWLKPKKKG